MSAYLRSTDPDNDLCPACAVKIADAGTERAALLTRVAELEAGMLDLANRVMPKMRERVAELEVNLASADLAHERLTFCITELKGALRPFADWADRLVGVNQVGDACPLSADPTANYGCATVADLRRAHAVLAQAPDNAQPPMEIAK